MMATREDAQIGAYRLIRQIGSGGMGEVWLAQHALLGRQAAIKLLHPMLSSQPEIVTRFFNEARAATSIADPGIVQVFDFGHCDGLAYLVMELLEGETLEARIDRERMLIVGDALRVLRQVASSLGSAHARGIVHRDIKPENIFIVRDPEVAGGERAKILDFGIAKLSEQAAGVKTQTWAMMGTPAYMSPEQCRGAGQVDPRSDVYALGCVLFTLIVGRPPFDSAGAGEIIAMHLREAPPVPSTRAPWVPPAVDRLILRCLAKEPADRFESGTELAVAIGALIEAPMQIAAGSRQLPLVAPRTTVAPWPIVTVGPQHTTLSAANGATPTQPLERRHNLVGYLIAAILVVLVLIVVTLRTRWSDVSALRPVPTDGAPDADPSDHTTQTSSDEMRPSTAMPGSPPVNGESHPSGEMPVVEPVPPARPAQIKPTITATHALVPTAASAPPPPRATNLPSGLADPFGAPEANTRQGIPDHR